MAREESGLGSSPKREEDRISGHFHREQKEKHRPTIRGKRAQLWLPIHARWLGKERKSQF